MTKSFPLSTGQKVIVASLLIAFLGVITQIISGYPYPTVPPVFFILLLPAALVFFVRWRWAPTIVVLAGVFLINGFFASGSATRMLAGKNPGDSAGLAIQMAGVAVAAAASIIALFSNRRQAV